MTAGMALESLYPAGVSQLSPSQAHMVNEGYSFSWKDPISLGIPVTRHFDRLKQDQQSRPMRRQIPIGAAHISFSGHTR